MSNVALPRGRRGFLVRTQYALLLATVLPWFLLVSADVWHTLSSEGSRDGPEKFFLLAVIRLVLPVTGLCLLAAIVLSGYLWLKSALVFKVQTMVWFAVFILGWIAPPPAAVRSSPRLAAQWLCFACSCGLPMIWMVRSARRNSKHLL